VLVIAAIAGGDTDRLLRAVLAATVVAAVWLIIIFAAPSAVGLGDVRLFVLTAGLLGWTGWWAVLYGELVAFVLALLTAAVLALLSPSHRGHRIPVPMGPAILLGAALVCWL
jgi:leader peptidase (prepilin peptidase)/N-methyltransferase